MVELSHPIEGMLGVSMEKIREMVDVNTIVGEPIVSPDGLMTIIPVSKVSFGFGSGGSDFGKADSALIKKNESNGAFFGGAAGAGVTIKPLAFLVIKVGEVELLQLSEAGQGLAKAVESVPDAVSRLFKFFKDKKDKDKKDKDK